MRTLSVLAALATMAAPVAVAADIHVSTQEALESTLKAARSGDRILMAPGEYGSIVLRGRTWSPALTIAAADAQRPPVLASIALSEVGGLKFSGLKVAYGPTEAPLTTYVVDIRRSADIAVSNLEVLSAANGIAGDDAYAVNIRDSKRIEIRNNNLHDVYRGVAVLDCGNVEVSGNDIRGVGSDGVVARGTVGLLVLGNTFTDFAIIDLNVQHPDAIQLWSRGASRANENIEIRGNIIRRGDGDPSQGIFIKTPEIATRAVIIEGNFVEQSMAQGILVQNGDGVIVRNNIVVPAKKGDRPGIEIRAPSSNAEVMENEAVAYRFAPGVSAERNR